MPAIPYRKAATSNAAWDGPAQEAALASTLDAATLRQEYAFERGIAPGTEKREYALPHHEAVGGKPGPANVKACRECLRRAEAIKPALTASERAGVRAHLVKHLSDALGAGNEQINGAIRAATYGGRA